MEVCRQKRYAVHPGRLLLESSVSVPVIVHDWLPRPANPTFASAWKGIQVLLLLLPQNCKTYYLPLHLVAQVAQHGHKITTVDVV